MSTKLVKRNTESSVPVDITESIFLTLFLRVIYEVVYALVYCSEHLPEFTGTECRGQGRPAAFPLVTVLQEQSERFLWS